MKTQRMKVIFSTLAILALVAGSSTNAKAQDPLPPRGMTALPNKPSWTLSARLTEKGGAKFVPPEERIATFDQDGTLCVEHPVYSRAVSSETAQEVLATRKRTPIQTLGA